ncbi:MAG: ABC transporter ATP-binding protein [Hyphomicrobiales bacterium]|nr:ABC transporter ATP-binding protein [Hyphomicrobiales bacterium]
MSASHDRGHDAGGAPGSGDQAALLAVNGLGAGYGDIEILWDINLAIRPKERVAIVGPNGAGKTTLLRTISGLLPRQGGNIHFDGRDIGFTLPHRRVELGISQVPEGRLLFAGMSVKENLMMGAFTVPDRTRVQSTYERTLEYFPVLRERQNQLAGMLSGGEQQMCAIGRALMSEPKVLLIDEMSMGLAPIIVDKLMKIVVQISEEARVAILLVEQDVHVALQITERGYVIENGRLVLEGRSAELLENNEIKRAYLGL